jgi:adenine/guanine phosphoribosyltransferase-like PRPP-binding protein
VTERRTYRATVGSQVLELPVVPLGDDLAIALLITVDLGVTFASTAGRELAAELAPFEPEVVVSVATMGIPLAMEVTRALGLDDYVILHKTPKIHLGDRYREPVRSITTGAEQNLRLDPARVDAVRGRRVAVVDDVISTGASIEAALALVRRVEADPVVVGVLVTEGSQWKSRLGGDADRVRSLGALPVFRRSPSGGWQEDWG